MSPLWHRLHSMRRGPRSSWAVVAFLSLRESAPAPVAAVAGGEGTSSAAPEERDLLFDVLCGGVVMAVVALYIVFF